MCIVTIEIHTQNSIMFIQNTNNYGFLIFRSKWGTSREEKNQREYKIKRVCYGYSFPLHVDNSIGCIPNEL